MLAQGAHHEAAFFATSSILKESIDNSLFGLATPMTLAVGDFHEGLIHSFNCKGFRLSQSKGLFLLNLERHVSCISILVVDCFQSSVVESASFP